MFNSFSMCLFILYKNKVYFAFHYFHYISEFTGNKIEIGHCLLCTKFVLPFPTKTDG
jgi:hypothetical protein